MFWSYCLKRYVDLGRLLNWTIAPDEGNRVEQIEVEKCKSRVTGEMKFVLTRVLGDVYGISDKDFLIPRRFFKLDKSYRY